MTATNLTRGQLNGLRQDKIDNAVAKRVIDRASPEERAALIGDNVPPLSDVEALLGRLRENHPDLLERREILIGACERAPTEILDEETAGKMADFVQKQIDPFLKRAKDVHQAEKEPFLSAGRTVDGFWHSLIDDLEKWKISLNKVRKGYADKKAAEERRRLEEQAAAARAEEERLRKEAEEKAAALKDNADLNKAIEAEEAAEQARIAADRAKVAAAAKPAVLGRSRGAHGGMTTLKEFWNFSDLDRSKIDLEALRAHLPAEGIEKAIRSWIAANEEPLRNGASLAGVRIFRDTRL